MSPPTGELTARIRRLVDVFNQTGLVRLRIAGKNEDAVELRRALRASVLQGDDQHASNGATETQTRRPFDVIKADLVGIAHLSRPVPTEGLQIDGDRELAYVEALGIRNPIRSLGSGRIAGVLVQEGQPVEYGQPLFEIERV